MEELFSRLLETHTPKVNPVIMNGLATIYMDKCEEYVDAVFRSAQTSFVNGLTYLGYERCTPQEEYEELSKSRNNKRTIDLAQSYIYLVKYKFAFNGVPLPDRHIALPYVDKGGVFKLGGAMYHITPVLSDKVISPGFDSIFVRLLRDKVIFKRCYHSVVIDSVRETSHVIWSQIYRKPKDNKKVADTTKAMTCVAHYLFAKFGFTEVFNKYVGFVPDIGGAEINDTTYPKDKWVICESSGVKPKTYIGEFYEPTTIRLAIPRHKWNPSVKELVIGFYYVVDHFPNRFLPTYVDNTDLWKILLGHIVFSGLYGTSKLHQSISEHFASIDDYVDVIIKEKLKENNYNVNDFYDLLMLILSNFNSLVLENENGNLSMYGKSLEVLYYVLYDITASIFKVNFRLTKMSVKRPLTHKDVSETFNRIVKPGGIYGLTSGKIISEAVSYSGDHMYPKITSKITEQEATHGATRGSSKRLVVGEDKHVDISMAEAGSILFLAKANPTPTNRANPFMCIDIETGRILPNPKFDKIRETTQIKLKGKTA